MSLPIRARFVLAAAGVLALALTATGTRLAASQESVLVARSTGKTVDVRHPWAEFWSGVLKVDVPVSAQQVTPPMGGRGSTLSVRAVHDQEDLFLLVEWKDPSPDRSVGRPQDFTDAAAVQFPAVAGTQVPAFCMGDPNATVNIWQWKAAWQQDIAHGFQGNVKDVYPNTAVDVYPFHGDPTYYPGLAVGNPFSQVHRRSAVDNLVAAGFGTLTADPTPLVQGWGVWRDGTWRVIFSRPLLVGQEGNVELHSDDWTDVAFAVWDGAAEERDGMKSVGNFIALDLSPDRLEPPNRWYLWPMYAVLALWLLLVVMVASDLPRAGG